MKLIQGEKMDEILIKNINSIKRLIKTGLNEDFNRKKDITSKAIFKNEYGKCRIIAKQSGVISGIDIAELVFKMIDKRVIFKKFKNDKDKLLPSDIVAEIEGKVISLLEGERTALNLLGYLSGIATITSRFVELAENNTKILDTRKILPCYRILAKYAVRCGGAENHRNGLYDMILIKDNHIDAAGSIEKAVNRVRKKYNNRYKIEVETRNLKEVEEALKMNVDRIMLDNMSLDMAKQALDIINKRIETEISGNIDEEKLIQYAKLKPTYISIGLLTHSVKCFDFSMKFYKITA